MIKTEATWIREALIKLLPKTVLNLGSSTSEFRTVDQPWVAEALDGFAVTHVDQKAAPGVDVVCDLETDAIQPILGRLFDLVILTSVLEHVNDRAAVLANAKSVTSKWLLVTVPNSWPYHPDPIDTMYRPSLRDLIALGQEIGLHPIDAQLMVDPRGSCVGVVFERGSPQKRKPQ